MYSLYLLFTWNIRSCNVFVLSDPVLHLYLTLCCTFTSDHELYLYSLTLYWIRTIWPYAVYFYCLTVCFSFIDWPCIVYILTLNYTCTLWRFAYICTVWPCAVPKLSGLVLYTLYLFCLTCCCNLVRSDSALYCNCIAWLYAVYLYNLTLCCTCNVQPYRMQQTCKLCLPLYGVTCVPRGLFVQGRQSRVVLLKAAEGDHVGHLLVKTEPKQEPLDTSSSSYNSLADLDGITDLLPIQTGQHIPPLQIELQMPTRNVVFIEYCQMH